VIEHRVDQFHQVLVRVFDEIDVILVGGSAASNSAKPMMAFRGVHNSWLMRETNSDLARLARSAASASS
jgi:hypothetical protein